MGGKKEVAEGIVEQALKLVMGGADDAAKSGMVRGTFPGSKMPSVDALSRNVDKFVYHSGTAKDIPDMKYGVSPQIGPWVREVLEGSADNDVVDEIMENAVPVSWWSKEPSWAVVKVARELGKPIDQVTPEDLASYGHVALIPKKDPEAESLYWVGEEGLNRGPYSDVEDITGRKVKAYDADLYSGNYGPEGVERNEYITTRTVEPYLHLTGNELVDFLRKTGQYKKSSGGRTGYQTKGRVVGDVVDAAMKLVMGGAEKAAPKVAYHATQEPFENYDWSRLGQTTKENTSGTSVEDWALALARLGPWSHEKPLSKKIGMKTDLPVMLTGKEREFKSLDHLAKAISRNGGPEALRGKLVSKGYGHVSVNDEEFGGKSYVGLSPEYFSITKAAGGRTGYQTKGRVIGDAVDAAMRLIAGVEPQKTAKAYKLFKQREGKLYPLFVDANEEVPLNQWLKAKAGEQAASGKVRSKIGELAYRPGWHAGDLPIATHIGARSHGNPKLPPDTRPSDQVWAEVDMADDVDWQKIANERARMTKKGTPDPKTAHITDQVPYGGYYRYKTNPNMTGNWMIGGDMRVNRVLTDDEVKAINEAAGVSDLPRREGYGPGGVIDDIVKMAGKIVSGADQYDPPPGFEKFWDAGLKELGSQKGRTGYGPGGSVDDIVKMAGLLGPMKGDGTWVENRPSKWQQTWDILSPYITGPAYAVKGLMDADPYTLMTDTGPAADEAVANSFNAAGAVTVGGSVVPKPRNAVMMGIRAYHGSPHDFPPVRLIEMPDGQRLYQNMGELADTPQGAKIIQEYPLGRFDMSKIGTGEGAQAYGNGLYFAENEGVAKGYRDRLTDTMKPGDMTDAGKAELQNRLQTAYADMANRLGMSVEDVAAVDSSTADELFEEMKKVALSEGRDWFNFPKGSMYEVNIAADPNTFLDWDKPLSEQPEAVRRLAGWTPEAEAEYRKASKSDTDALLAALEGESQYVPAKMPQPPSAILPFSATGDELHQKLFHQARRELEGRGASGAYSARVAEKLREAGIPGIKYLDAGSRGAGEGTRNYVVFDDRLISIIRKYGIAGASAMLGYNLMEQLDPKQALAASMADQDYQSSRPQRSMGGNNSVSGALNVARGLHGVK